jgi:Rrf2 family protein
MELTRQADYALRCVLETARHERISARELADRQALSPSFVGKIVSALARAGILETHRGASGGVQLGRPADAISVLEVVEAVQGPVRLNRCVRTPPACELADSCALSPVIHAAQDALTTAFSVTVAQVLDGTPHAPPARLYPPDPVARRYAAPPPPVRSHPDRRLGGSPSVTTPRHR